MNAKKKTKKSKTISPMTTKITKPAQPLTPGMKKRSSAIILHITSLPGPFGIGVLGEEAIEFATMLSESKTAYWQILPLYLPIDNSPYNSLSTFAANTHLIDPRGLAEMDLLESDEIASFYYEGEEHSVDYAFVKKNSEAYLRLAFSRLQADQRRALEDFVAKKKWISDYAAFRILHEQHEKAWWEWPTQDRIYSPERVYELRTETPEDFEFYCFGQWIFHLQWQALTEVCHELGVGILGDIPYYVAADSADTWANPENFQMNEDLSPKWIAGVPPDYFAVDGQLWGNTVYDWDYLAKHKFDWWMERLDGAFELYDALRLDHFRAFDTYWRIDAAATTAREGTWMPGPGMKFFKALKKRFGALPIIAEDLGDLTDDVRQLVIDSEFPGMKVLQFAFETRADNMDQPHHFEKNLCVYTGTHDNDTLLGWIWSCSAEERKYVLDYLNLPEDIDWGKGGTDSLFCQAMIRMAWASVARFAACPFQDLMGYGTDTRMNVPGIEEGQWMYRASLESFEQFPVEQLRVINELYGRAGSFNFMESALAKAKTPTEAELQEAAPQDTEGSEVVDTENDTDESNPGEQ